MRRWRSEECLFAMLNAAREEQIYPDLVAVFPDLARVEPGTVVSIACALCSELVRVQVSPGRRNAFLYSAQEPDKCKQKK
jgi:hypothetical protein